MSEIEEPVESVEAENPNRREWVMELCEIIAPRPESGARIGAEAIDSGIRGAARVLPVKADGVEDTEGEVDNIYSQLNHLQEGSASHAMWELAERLLLMVYPNDDAKQSEYRNKPDYPQRDFDDWLKSACKDAEVEPPLTIRDVIHVQCYRQDINISKPKEKWQMPITRDIIFEASAGRYQYVPFKKGLEICRQIGLDTQDNLLSAKTISDISSFKRQEARLKGELGDALFAFKNFFAAIAEEDLPEQGRLNFTDGSAAEQLGIESTTFKSYRNSGIIPSFTLLTRIIELFGKVSTSYLQKIDINHHSSDDKPLLESHQMAINTTEWSIDDFLDIGKKIAQRFEEKCQRKKPKETKENKEFREAVSDIIDVCNMAQHEFAPMIFTGQDIDRKSKQVKLSTKLKGKFSFQADEIIKIMGLLGVEDIDALQDLHADIIKVLAAREKMFVERGADVLCAVTKVSEDLTTSFPGKIVRGCLRQHLEHYPAFLNTRKTRDGVLHSNEIAVAFGLDNPDAFVQAALFPPYSTPSSDRNEDVANKINDTASWKLRVMDPEHSYEFDAMKRMRIVTDDDKPAFERVAKLTHDLRKKIKSQEASVGVGG